MTANRPFSSASALALLATISFLAGRPAAADSGHLTVQVDKPGAAISPLLYGLMTEEINYSYDGGLYGELIQNRIFRDAPDTRYRRPRRGSTTPPPGAELEPAPIPHWSAVTRGGAKATIALDTTDPVNTTALTTSLKVTIDADGGAGVANDGYWGIPVRPKTTYRASFYAKASPDFTGPLNVSIESSDGGAVQASGSVPKLSGEWKRYTVTLTTSGSVTPSTANRFVLSAAHKGTLWFNLVSLFPPTYKNRPNGNRVDLMEKLADMHPAFLRFPGGNYVEGNSWADRWNWKATIGPLEERAGHGSPWGYRSSDGMGLMEFLLWCEDLKIQPVLAVFAGHILGRGDDVFVTGKALDPYVQEALDEIEYITGDTSTRWGAQRARDGHPKPFPLPYIEVGNEDNLSNGLGSYEERFTRFYDAIKARYPSIQIISTVPSGQRDYVRTSKPDLIDDHFYMSIPQALTRAHMYDNYSRATKIFVGEWATRVGSPTCTCAAAVADAAFLTGLERNADLIRMSCYAPLLVNVNHPYPQYEGGPPYGSGMQWGTDLIGYDALSSYGSPSYYVQQMFSANRGDVVLPVDLVAPPAPAPAGTDAASADAPPSTLFASASRDKATGDIILKVVNASAAEQSLEITLQGASSIAREAKGQILTGQPDDVNSLAEPERISPKPLTVSDAGTKFTHAFPANSVSVIRLKTR